MSLLYNGPTTCSWYFWQSTLPLPYSAFSYIAVNHRKRLTPDTGFPAPLQNLLAGYLYPVMDLGFKPGDITLVGNSSGAHLVLGLGKYPPEIDSKDIYVGTSSALILALVSMPYCIENINYWISCSHWSICPTHPRHPFQAIFWRHTSATGHNHRCTATIVRMRCPPIRTSAPQASSLGYLARAQRQSGLEILMLHSSIEILYEDHDVFIEKMRSQGVEFELDVIEGGSHLDAGIVFALLNRRPLSSWVRLLTAMGRMRA